MLPILKKAQTHLTHPLKNLSKTVLTTAMDAALNGAGSALDTISHSSVDEMISQTGKTRQEIINLCLADDEVDACREDIESAIIAKAWRIYDDVSGDGERYNDPTSGVPPAVINRFYKAIRPLIKDFASLAVLAKFNGYAIAEYVYKQEMDGFWVIDKVLSKDGQLDSYQLKKDGSVLFNQNGKELTANTDIKLLVLTSRAVPARPTGEMLLLKAYPMVALRRRGLAYAGQFIARYAQPYVVGRQGNMGGVGLNMADFTQRLFGFINGGATGIGADDEINIHQLQGNGDAFEIIERLCNRRIQKLLLGRVKVSEMTSGSRAASETDDKARMDRIRAYLDLMTHAIQHAIDAMLSVNNAYGNPIDAPEGLWFEYIEEMSVDVGRAERDKIYADTGQIAFTKDYMIDMVGLEAHHFRVLDDSVGGEERLQQTDSNPPHNAQTKKAPLPNQTDVSNNKANQAQQSPIILTLSDNTADTTATTDDKLLDELPDPPKNFTTVATKPIKDLVGLIDKCDDYDSFARAFSQIKAAHQIKDSELINELADETANAFMDGLMGKAEPTEKTQSKE